MVKKEHWKLESPGVSRHSERYLCTVKEAGVTGGRGLTGGVGTMWVWLQVRQIGADSIEVDFVAEGDGSKGALQKLGPDREGIHACCQLLSLDLSIWSGH